MQIIYNETPGTFKYHIPTVCDNQPYLCPGITFLYEKGSILF